MSAAIAQQVAAVEKIFGGLKSFHPVKPTNGNAYSWQACCPAHEDRTPSLSITISSDDKVLAHCFAGCSTEIILGKLNRSFKDLAPPQSPERRIDAIYDYCDRDGRLCYQVIRHIPKAFLQQRPDGNGGWISNLQGVRRVPYRLPELIASTDDTVLICEGEKDVLTAVSLGFTATCNSSGAGKWHPEFSEHLRGKKAIIIADADAPGRQHAKQVASSLKGKATSIKVLEMPGVGEKGDLTDWMQLDSEKNNRAALQVLIAQAPEWEESGGLVTSSAAGYLSMAFPPREAFMVNGKNSPVFTSSSINQIFAYRGTGKSLLALSCAVAMAAGDSFLCWKASRPVRTLYIEGETPDDQLQGRLRQITNGRQVDSLFIVSVGTQPNGIPSIATEEGWKAIESAIEKHGIEAIVFDSLSTLAWIPTNDEEAWIPLLGWLNRLRNHYKLCITFLHHAGKSGLSRGHSRGEDLLDLSIELKRAKDEDAEYLKCRLHYDKVRGDRPGFRDLDVEYQHGEWSYQSSDATREEVLRDYRQDNPKASIRKILEDIGPALGLTSTASIQRLVKKMEGCSLEL